MKKAILKSYGKKGEDIVNMNYAAVDAGGNAVVKIDVPAEWASIEDKGFEHASNASYPEFVRKIVEPINGLKGDMLPVSAFNGREDGTWDNGTASLREARHRRQRSRVEDRELYPVQPVRLCLPPRRDPSVPRHRGGGRRFGRGLEAGPGRNQGVQVPHPDLAARLYGLLELRRCLPRQGEGARHASAGGADASPEELGLHHQSSIGYKQVVDKTKSVKNLQFAQPLFEFSGACAGCGETPYIKAISQLFGDKMMVANATGCTSIYSGSAPSTPYCTNAEGHGPAWANSLFEDNAEFGLGMHVGVEKLRDRIQLAMEDAIANCAKCSDELKGVMKEWIENRGSSAKSAEVTARLIPLMEACGCDACKKILEHKEWLVKKSQWIIGGDGWGYDIGYGGVDHVLASGQDVNILVVDTEVYSNTGGQSSKSTPVRRRRQIRIERQAHPQEGPRRNGHDLRLCLCGPGFDRRFDSSSCSSVLKEAEAYPGPSLVIAYAPCINHGIKGGMTRSADRRQGGCGLRLLAPVALQPDARGAGQESVRAGFEGARLVEVPRIPDEGGSLHVAPEGHSPPRPTSCSPLPRRTPSGATTVMCVFRRWSSESSVQ